MPEIESFPESEALFKEYGVQLKALSIVTRVDNKKGSETLPF